ncbi:MAG: MotA/TolQ/ExbB proton channel family protein [Gammaproteobacteria bacterium]|nr:MotA/TolQ/ExbB proton channel family protein [Gammaproteobacteria bacterium]
MKIRNLFLAAIIAGLAGMNVSAAEEAAPAVKSPEARTLDELLRLVKQNKNRQSKVNQEREAIFLQQRNNQRNLLNQALAEQKREEDRTERLKAEFEKNETILFDLTEKLNIKAGTLGEMVGVVRQVAGDSAERIERSIVSAQYPGRHKDLEKLAQAKEFPEIPEIRGLWIEMLNEIVEQGKVSRFNGDIINTEGRPESRDMIRIGVFNMLSDGEYLVYDHKEGDIKQLNRAPAGRYTGLINDYMDETTGYEELALDPSRGNILTLEVKRESWYERVMNYAGLVGAGIGVVLLVGLIIVVERLLTLFKVRGQIAAQEQSSTPGNNPLGRIMAVYQANKGADQETLELKLDEAVLKETPQIERGINIIKVFAAIAPLMGLLGTVTGMIETFQGITLYGTGDPKIMAGGISSALITTVLGIVAALPLILTHSVVSGISKGIIHTLEEQSTGLIAQHEEKAGA